MIFLLWVSVVMEMCWVGCDRVQESRTYYVYPSSLLSPHHTMYWQYILSVAYLMRLSVWFHTIDRVWRTWSSRHRWSRPVRSRRAGEGFGHRSRSMLVMVRIGVEKSLEVRKWNGEGWVWVKGERRKVLICYLLYYCILFCSVMLCSVLLCTFDICCVLLYCKCWDSHHNNNNIFSYGDRSEQNIAWYDIILRDTTDRRKY